jgi:hypothetical protein
MYALEIQWQVPGLPSLIGPFFSRAEAEGWAALNVANGSWEVRPLAGPYRDGG